MGKQRIYDDFAEAFGMSYQDLIDGNVVLSNPYDKQALIIPAKSTGEIESIKYNHRQFVKKQLLCQTIQLNTSLDVQASYQGMVADTAYKCYVANNSTREIIFNAYYQTIKDGIYIPSTTRTKIENKDKVYVSRVHKTPCESFANPTSAIAHFTYCEYFNTVGEETLEQVQRLLIKLKTTKAKIGIDGIIYPSSAKVLMAAHMELAAIVNTITAKEVDQSVGYLLERTRK